MKYALPTRIAISGATGAIGGALAKLYASPKTKLYLHGRNDSALLCLAKECRLLGAYVETFSCDVTDTLVYREWLYALGREEPLDLFVACAGININVGPHGEGETIEDIERIISVNITASLVGASIILASMKMHRRGQLALFSSLAGYYGLPQTPSYSGSKAALKAYGEGARAWAQNHNVRVNVVMPGYVDSAMCRGMPGPKPFLWTADKAAGRIFRGLIMDKPRITFPFPLNLGCWLLATLPSSVSQRMLKVFGYV